MSPTDQDKKAAEAASTFRSYDYDTGLSAPNVRAIEIDRFLKGILHERIETEKLRAENAGLREAMILIHKIRAISMSGGVPGTNKVTDWVDMHFAVLRKITEITDSMTTALATTSDAHLERLKAAERFCRAVVVFFGGERIGTPSEFLTATQAYEDWKKASGG